MSKKPTAAALLAKLNGPRQPSATALDEARRLLKRSKYTLKDKRDEQARTR